MQLLLLKIKWLYNLLYFYMHSCLAVFFITAFIKCQIVTIYSCSIFYSNKQSYCCTSRLMYSLYTCDANVLLLSLLSSRETTELYVNINLIGDI